jgi:hypothetical protein
VTPQLLVSAALAPWLPVATHQHTTARAARAGCSKLCVISALMHLLDFIHLCTLWRAGLLQHSAEDAPVAAGHVDRKDAAAVGECCVCSSLSAQTSAPGADCGPQSAARW